MESAGDQGFSTQGPKGAFHSLISIFQGDFKIRIFFQKSDRIKRHAIPLMIKINS